MLTQTARLTTALGRSYRLERELGAGGMATVCDVLDYLAGGMSEDEILADFPDVEREDIRAALGKR